MYRFLGPANHWHCQFSCATPGVSLRTFFKVPQSYSTVGLQSSRKRLCLPQSIQRFLCGFRCFFQRPFFGVCCCFCHVLCCRRFLAFVSVCSWFACWSVCLDSPACTLPGPSSIYLPSPMRVRLCLHVSQPTACDGHMLPLFWLKHPKQYGEIFVMVGAHSNKISMMIYQANIWFIRISNILITFSHYLLIFC